MYEGLLESFGAEQEESKRACDSNDPMAMFQNPDKKPVAIRESGLFQMLMLLRCLRPGRVVPAVMFFVRGKLGEDFAKPPPFGLRAATTTARLPRRCSLCSAPGPTRRSRCSSLHWRRAKKWRASRWVRAKRPRRRSLWGVRPSQGTGPTSRTATWPLAGCPS